MLRIFVCLVAFAALAGFVLHSPTTAAEDESGILELTLPESSTPPSWGPDQVSKLSVDGKDYSTPRLTKRTIKVTPKKGKDTVVVEYTFWPLTYTRVIRTKTVKVEKGKTVKVNFDKGDKETPDKHFVIFVPTPQTVVDEMCKLAKIGKDDVVYDIGCGDGRLGITAVKKYGAKKSVGIDLSKVRIAESKERAKKEGVSDKCTFMEKDALTIKDFSEATVVLIYLSDALNAALQPTLTKTMKPGSRIVSHRFVMKDWEPDTTKSIKAKDDSGDEDDYDLHLWTIKKKK